ncbi:MAG: GUN4 domain-containing protein [Calothrix sp. FI2-JRJ7]|jgi:serine/threonine protein kinase|nr:GUN4 domain-containing protein [Calothrix sp. FI2-JRJ7]
MSWQSGQQLNDGNYVIEKKLGQGGFGITYLAKSKTGNQVVIKTLKQTNSDDFDKSQQDFVNEALKLAKCFHPHIVKVYECIKVGNLWGIVMEYIEGEELSSKKLPLQESEALCYINQIGEALEIVHKNGLLHRDVKPNNIIIRTGKLEAVLIDFGIAREFKANATQTHTEFITPFYAPPEQYNPRAKRGAFTDVYSLAATLYKVLTGKEPESSISRAIGCTLASPKKLNTNLSNKVNEAILKGLELVPENRPQSIKEWLQLLQNDSAYIPKNVLSNLSISTNTYSYLETLLANGRWKEADIETKNLLLKLCSREVENYLTYKNILNINSQDICTIDELWVKHSNGHLGFSVQKKIWNNNGGDIGNFDEEAWIKFGETVGWRSTRQHQILFASWTSREWSYYSQIEFSLNAPKGHLPRLWDEWRGGVELVTIASKIESCTI